MIKPGHTHKGAKRPVQAPAMAASPGPLVKAAAGKAGGLIAKPTDTGGLKKQAKTPFASDRGAFTMKG